MKKKVIIIAASFALLLIIFMIRAPLFNQSSIDLIEAYEIANSTAIQWNEESKPYFITSVDDFEENNQLKGENGKRKYWNFDFITPNTNEHLLITIHDKKVVNNIEAKSEVDEKYIIDINKLKLTTKEAVLMAKNQYKLLPGEDWAEGYHFVLENDTNLLSLIVVGLNQEKEMVRIRFNAQTGEVIN